MEYEDGDNASDDADKDINNDGDNYEVSDNANDVGDDDVEEDEDDEIMMVKTM